MAEGGVSPDFAPRSEVTKKAPLEAVVVCGMGPLELADIKASKRKFPTNPNNRLNANAAKLLASHHLVDTVITSGRTTAEVPKELTKELDPQDVYVEQIRSELKELEKGSESKDKIANNEVENDEQAEERIMERIKQLKHKERELETSEAALLADTFDRMGGKAMTKEGREKAAETFELDEKSRTTFGNIIEALNKLDAQHNGLFDGSFGVLSAQFHMPRIAEMIKAFGLRNTHALSAEQILRQFGHTGRIYPTGDFGYGKSYEAFEEDVYAGQPGGLENLRDNPSYVSFELKNVQSDRRLQQMALSLKTYYQASHVTLPDVYAKIPEAYDHSFDYDHLRNEFAQIPFTKHAYQGDMTTDDYRMLAGEEANKTTAFLQEITSAVTPPLQEASNPLQ